MSWEILLIEKSQKGSQNLLKIIFLYKVGENLGFPPTMPIIYHGSKIDFPTIGIERAIPT